MDTEHVNSSGASPPVHTNETTNLNINVNLININLGTCLVASNSSIDFSGGRQTDDTTSPHDSSESVASSDSSCVVDASDTADSAPSNTPDTSSDGKAIVKGENEGKEEKDEAESPGLRWAILDKVANLYDRCFKQIVTLSPKVTVLVVNGLFGTHFSLDSKVTYLNTVSTNEVLVERIGDTGLLITGKDTETGEEKSGQYAIEFQCYSDTDIPVRTFDSVYLQSLPLRTKEPTEVTLDLAESVILRLSTGVKLPATVSLTFRHKGKTVYSYPAPQFMLFKHSFEDNAENRLPLLPFELLRFKSKLKRSRSPENLNAFYELCGNIVTEIKSAHASRLLTGREASTLLGVYYKLYRYDFSDKYPNEIELEGVNSMGVNWLDLQLPQEVLDLEAANKRLETMETDLEAEKNNREMAEANLEVAEANLEVAETNMQSLIDLLKSKGATDNEIKAVLVGMPV